MIGASLVILNERCLQLMNFIDMWLARHTPENTMPVIEKVLAAVKEEYGDKKYTVSLGTYVVGYCFGGKYALRLAAGDQIVACCVAHGLYTLFLSF